MSRGVRHRRRFAQLVCSLVFTYEILFVLVHPPVALTEFKTWNAIPGFVTDSEGRTGQLYRAPHGTIELVVFEKGQKPRIDQPIDRYFTPFWEKDPVFMQCTVNLRTLFVGHNSTYGVFKHFLLTRIDGNGWASDGGGIATLKPEGHPNTYLLTEYLMRPMPPKYAVKFQVLH